MRAHLRSQSESQGAPTEVEPTKKGLHRIPPDMLREEIIHNQISNSEHITPKKLELSAIAETKLDKKRQQDALARLAEASKHLPPPVDSISLLKPKQFGAPKPAQIEIPEEPAEEPIAKESTPRPPPKTEWIHDGTVQRSNPRLKNPESSIPAINAPLQAVLNEVPAIRPLPVDSASSQLSSSQKQSAAQTFVKQPWKLTIRKEMFYPGEKLNDAQVIAQIFAQVIDDCKRFIPYRIRNHEREQVKAILKENKVPPELLGRQEEIPVGIKAQVVESARSWPLYFSQIHEVIEERLNENIYLLLALSETGIRLLVQNPLNKENPLKIQDHFDFADVKSISVEGVDKLVLQTRSGMQVSMKTNQAAYICAQIERCLHGKVQKKIFVRATADYITKVSNFLSFVKGDVIEILPRDDSTADKPGWLYGRIGNSYGNLPEEYVESLDATYAETHSTVESPPPIAAESTPSQIGAMLPNDDIEINDYNFDDVYESGADNKHTMMEFALMYFRGIKSNDGTKTRRNKEWATWRDVADKVKWTDKPISQSLLRIENTDANKIAADAFGCIQRYMGDESLKKGESKTDCVYRILLRCRKFEAMRDEIYCQIIRQTTNNRSQKQDSCVLGWRLFHILTAYFTCSQAMWPYLIKYLTENAGDNRRPCHSVAQACLSNILKTKKYGGRRFLLSGKEVEEITTRGCVSKRQLVFLPGTNEYYVNVKTVTVVEEIIQELCNALNIRSLVEQQEFCLTLSMPDESPMVFTANDEYILDICTEMEHREKTFKFLLRRTVWIHPLRLDNYLYIDVMFFQLMPDYLDGFFCSFVSQGRLSAASMDDVAKMGAYLYVSSENGNRGIVMPNLINKYVPASVITRSIGAEQWATRIQFKLDQLDSHIDATSARAHFLQILDKWPLFGATLFPVTKLDPSGDNIEVVLSIQRRGIQLLQPLSHVIVEEWPFSQVLSTYKSETDNILEIRLGTVRDNFALLLHTTRAADIIRLFGQSIYVDSKGKTANS